MYTLSVSKYVSENAEAILPFAVETRRALHQIPELSDEEYKTSEYIFSRLTALGYCPVRIHTGMFVDIPGSVGKKRIAFRADFDALPLTENTGLKFASVNGCMHACGHDAHTAMALSLAALLKETCPENNIRIIFQFGEEGNGGAAKMIEGGAIDGVDMIFALHLSPEVAKGEFATRPGALFAGVVEFDVDIKGKSSHVAKRGAGADALLAAAGYIVQMNAVTEGNDAVRYQTGKIMSGAARNIVADAAKLECTLRYFDKDDRSGMMDAALKVLSETSSAAGVRGSIDIKCEYPPLINDKNAVEIFSKANKTTDIAPSFTGEDFAMYLEVIPGCMVWLGVRDENHTYPLHSDKFDFDENVMSKGIQAFLNLINI